MPRKRANGEGTIIKRTIKRKDGTIYTRFHARITLDFKGKKQLQRDGPWREKQQEAKNDLARLLREAKRGGLNGEASQTLQTYIESWLERGAKSKKFRTYQTYEQDLRNHVLPRLGHLPLLKLTKLDIQNMIDGVYAEQRRLGNKGEAVTRKARAALRKALEDAITLEILPPETRNPCEKVEVPSEPISEIVIWTKAQSAQFMAEARCHRIYPIIYTAITSGMREGELCALKWSDLEVVPDAQAPDKPLLLITIRRSLVVVPKRYKMVADVGNMEHVIGRYYFDAPKTKKSKGSVLVGHDTLQLLTEHRRWQQEHAAKLGTRWHDFGLVFPASNGAPQSPDNLLRDYYKIIDKAGVPRLTFHDLRDTHASRLLAAGKDIGVVSERLRHSRKSTTLDRYVHVLESRRREGAMSLVEIFDS